MSDVNKQLIVAAKDILALHDNEVFVADPWNDSMENLRQAIVAAEQAQRACRDCNGTGDRDSGGVHPWGAPIMVPCDCQAQHQAEPDGYVQGIECAAMLCQKEADELLSENRFVFNRETETKAETAGKLSAMLLSVAKDAAAQKGGA